MLDIDASYLEGGGQIIRTALALSALTKKPFMANNIRSKRPVPGLKAQHLFCIKALQQLTNARVENAELGSTTLAFMPRELKAKNLEIDIGTAGSITLLLQSLLLPCCFLSRKITLTITGGTDTQWSPQMDYLQHIILPHYAKLVDSIELKLIKRGYYPKGQGLATLEIRPKSSLADFPLFEEFTKSLRRHIPQIALGHQGNLLQIKGVSHASKGLMDAKVAERQAQAAHLLLSKRCKTEITTEYRDTMSIGSGITLYAICSRDEHEIDFNNPIRIGADTLGERGRSAESVGEHAAKLLIAELDSGAAVDRHMADNMIPLLGLLGGSFRASAVTSHTLTNIWASEQFLGKMFTVNDTLISAQASKNI